MTDNLAEFDAFAATAGTAISETPRGSRVLRVIDVPNDIPLSFDRGDWTDRTIAALKLLWSLGFSTAAIGARLGFTKNAIVGKAHRLDLPSRPSPISRVGDPSPRAVAPRVTGTTLPPLASTAPSVVFPLSLPGAPAQRPVAVNFSAAARSRFAAPARPTLFPIAPPAPRAMTATCLYPLWRNDERPTHKYCGVPIPLGESWCSGCRSVVFIRTRVLGVAE